MSWRSGRPRYRGYRPPPLSWFKLKYRAAVAGTAAMVVFATYVTVCGILSGRVPPISKQSDQRVEWASAPGRFVWHLFLWAGADLILVGIFCLLFAKLKALSGPSAETRT